MLTCPQHKYALELSKKSREGTRIVVRKKLSHELKVKDHKNMKNVNYISFTVNC